MTVYVDDMSNYKMGEYKRSASSYRTMKMSHMIADTEAELHEMAAKIGVAQHWYQGDHYDVCLSAKREALKRGAVLISMRQCAAMVYLQKFGEPMGDPETAVSRMLAMKTARRNHDDPAAPIPF